MKSALAVFLVGAAIGAPGMAIIALGGLGPLTAFAKAGAGAAAVFLVTSITSQEIRDDYNGVKTTIRHHEKVVRKAPGKTLKILIVPGHEPASGGAEFGGVAERNIVADIADDLAGYLNQDSGVEVMASRSKTAWDPTLQDYFDTHAADIEAFRADQALEMAKHLSDKSVLLSSDQVYHVTTATKGAIELYGINKWTSENGYDITLHLHVNDYGGRHKGVGRYDGYAVYAPDHQYSNAAASKELGEAIAGRLAAYHATSTMPGEAAGVVEDQQLIAIGSNNSADNAALLIEYGYIYEPQFQDASTRPLAEADYAYATYLGLRDFLQDSIATTTGSATNLEDVGNAAALPGERGAGVYALQAALHSLGFYPPLGKSLVTCPVSGLAGACTKEAITAYQSSRGLEETGAVGPQTRAALAEEDALTP